MSWKNATIEVAELPTQHGLLRPWERGRAFELEMFDPSPGVREIIQRVWIARWDLRGRAPFYQEILPHPSINFVVEDNSASIWGVPTERAGRTLDGKGQAVGVKFQPGAFTAITGIEAVAITNAAMAPLSAFPEISDPILQSGGTDRPADSIVDAIEAVLASYTPVDDPALDLLADVMANMGHLSPGARVEDIARANYLSARALQRLFRRYVGVGPKWVLKRLRIHQAVEQLASEARPEWSALARKLGYYDHAHFIRDFQLIVGQSPSQYAREAAKGHEGSGAMRE